MEDKEYKSIVGYLTDLKSDQKLLLREIEVITENQKDQNNKLDKMKDALYDPESGLYTQLRKNRSDISQLRIQLSNIGGGEDLSDLRSAIKGNKLVAKIMTIATAATVTGVIGTVLAFFL